MEFLTRYITSTEVDTPPLGESEFGTLVAKLNAGLEKLPIESKYEGIIYFPVIINPERGIWEGKNITYKHGDKSIYLKHQYSYEDWMLADFKAKFLMYALGYIAVIDKVRSSAIPIEGKESIMAEIKDAIS